MTVATSPRVRYCTAAVAHVVDVAGPRRGDEHEQRPVPGTGPVELGQRELDPVRGGRGVVEADVDLDRLGRARAAHHRGDGQVRHPGGAVRDAAAGWTVAVTCRLPSRPSCPHETKLRATAEVSSSQSSGLAVQEHGSMTDAPTGPAHGASVQSSEGRRPARQHDECPASGPAACGRPAAYRRQRSRGEGRASPRRPRAGQPGVMASPAARACEFPGRRPARPRREVRRRSHSWIRTQEPCGDGDREPRPLCRPPRAGRRARLRRPVAANTRLANPVTPPRQATDERRAGRRSSSRTAAPGPRRARAGPRPVRASRRRRTSSRRRGG